MQFLAAVALLALYVGAENVQNGAVSKRGNSDGTKRDHCNKTVDIYEDVSSPELTSLNRGHALTCWYRFRSFRGAPRDWVLRLRFKRFKVGTLINATHCDGGYLQIVDGNAKTDVSNRREPGQFCGEAEQPQTFISETSYVRVLFHTDNFTDQTYFSFDSRAEQQLEVYLRYGQHPELYPNRRGEVVPGSYCEREFKDCRLQTCYVQSPAYPGLYPRALKCRYRLHTRLPFIKLYLQNEHFAVDGQRCENIMTCPMRPIGSGSEHCPYDWLSVFDGRDDQAPLIGTFCGMGKFPHSIIGTSQHLYVEFVSSPAGPLLNTGFHFNVGNWPGHVDTAGTRKGHCDWLLSSDALRASGDSEGIFLSVAHWYHPHTACSYHIQGRRGEIVRLYFPSFRINRIEAAILPAQGDCSESLTLYDADGADDARIIKTFCDTFSRPMEKVDFVSTGSSMFVRFESKTGSYSGSSLYYWAHYDFFNDTRFGIPVQGTPCDETFPAWGLPATSGGYTTPSGALGGYLRSPLNSLVYKAGTGSGDVRCRYRFITDRRLYSRVVLDITNVAFKEHPYSQGPCTRCNEDRVDKLIISEGPGLDHTPSLNCICAPIGRPVRIVSSGEQLTLEMLVQGTHAAASYFKHPGALFEAKYQFAHGPLCGPATIGPTSDGELVYPNRAALGLPLPDPPRREHCIWAIRVAPQRDLWLHLDKARFSGRSCEDGRIEISLAGKTEPRFIVCGDNITLAKDLPILSSAELGAKDGLEGVEPPPVMVQFTGDCNPARVAFRLVWTELYHLPRNADGTLATSQYSEGGQNCEFACAGGTGLCIPSRLVCNGEDNCPNYTSIDLHDTSYIADNLRKMGLWDNLELRTLKYLSDESPEICNRAEDGDLQWLGMALGAAAGALLAIACVAVMCRACRKKRY